MDNVGGTALRWNVDAIKEPRGFIKLIEFIIAIFAFATTTSNSSSSSVVFNCGANATVPAPSEVVLNWDYPFKIDNTKVSYTLCNGTQVTSHPYGDFGAPSQFYVFVGVMAFLYSLGAVVLYVCFDDKYRQFDQIPIFDFCASCAFVLMWLISASAWATGVNQLKTYTDPHEWKYDMLGVCRDEGYCTVKTTGNYASLNVSLIFGFLNMGVWAANLWFLYKETKWYKVQEEVPPPASTPETPQQI